MIFKSKLKHYAFKSTLMDFTIKYGTEVFKFNLQKELRIMESHISADILQQPSQYAFLTMLHKEFIRELGLAKIEETKSYASAYLKYKKQISGETGRSNSDEVAKQKAERSILYLQAQRKVVEMNHIVHRIGGCVEAFEMRASMLQTLSANHRATNKM